MKFLITGGRNFNDYQVLAKVMKELIAQSGRMKREIMIIQGCADGADKLARLFAEAEGYHYADVPARWRDYGRYAGPLRNSHMLNLKPDVVVSFPGGAGTAHMTKIAREKGLRVIMVDREGNYASEEKDPI